MVQLLVKTRAGTEETIETAADISVMEAIRDDGIDEILALCGGCLSCATCHVYVDPEYVSLLAPMSDDENDLLESSSHRKPNSRLSCQIRLAELPGGLKVAIAPED